MVVDEKSREVRDLLVWSRPMRFEEFICSYGSKHLVELVDGVVVEKSMVQLDHFRLEKWLLKLLDSYVQRAGLGEVFGSRSRWKVWAVCGWSSPGSSMNRGPTNWRY